MTKIRTAEEILQDTGIKGSFRFHDQELNEHTKFDVVYAMQEYAKQFIDLAADSAEAELDYDFHDAFVNKESILKLKERVV